MKKLSGAVTAVMLVAAISPWVFAGEIATMRCGNGIVSIGDTAGEVISKCGEPAFTTQRERKQVLEGVKGSRTRTVTVVTIDDWTFNFGPDEFQYQLLLENGRVSRIESLGYGYSRGGSRTRP